METEIIKILIERIGHLETVLFSSAFGFLITTTIALFTAVYSLKNASKVELSSKFLLTGSNVIYVLLSGYYYFILTHFYAAASTVIPFKDKIPDTLNIETLWNSFQLSIPFVGEQSRIYLSLINAPLFPFLFSTFSIIGIWFLVKKEIKPKSNRKFWLIGSILTQLILFYLMIWHPFNQFIEMLIK